MYAKRTYSYIPLQIVVKGLHAGFFATLHGVVKFFINIFWAM